MQRGRAFDFFDVPATLRGPRTARLALSGLLHDRVGPEVLERICVLVSDILAQVFVGHGDGPAPLRVTLSFEAESLLRVGVEFVQPPHRNGRPPEAKLAGTSAAILLDRWALEWRAVATPSPRVSFTIAAGAAR